MKLDIFKKLYILIIVSILAAIVYIFVSINAIKGELKQNIDQLLVKIAKENAYNIDTILKEKLKNEDILKSLIKNKKLRKDVEEILSIISTDFFKYVYILYRDKKGAFRYLVDGSKEDKGEFNQILNVNLEEWNRVYKTKKENIIYQSNIDILWITYLYPIIEDKKVVAVLAIDFSYKLPKSINEMMKPLNRSFLFIFITILALIVLFSIQIYLTYKTKIKSFIDPLTGAYNRYYLREFLEKHNFDDCQIILLDIDYFRNINETYGHLAGDKVLKNVTNIIKNIIREDDLLFRYGGEEFLIFIKKDKDIDIAKKIAIKIKNTIENSKFYYNNQTIKTTVSMGINKFPERFKTISKALKFTDELLYLAKKDGRNCIRDSKKSDQSLYQISLTEIKEAIEEDRVICYYQPIYDTKRLEIIKYEALVRLIRRDKSIISPYLFLDQIFSTTLYTNLTNNVINRIFKEIKEKKVNISINLNFSDLEDNKLYKNIIKIIKTHKDFAKYLTIELLEKEELKNIDILKTRIDEIKSFGATIALDDFGTGYANFDIFKHLAIDIIKIDGSLIKDLPKSKISYEIVKAIISFGKGVDTKIVAEFVHSKEVAETLASLEIDYLQGFYLSPPIEKIVKVQ